MLISLMLILPLPSRHDAAAFDAAIDAAFSRHADAPRRATMLSRQLLRYAAIIFAADVTLLTLMPFSLFFFFSLFIFRHA